MILYKNTRKILKAQAGGKTTALYQTGDDVTYGTPEYKEAYNRGEVITAEGGRSPVALNEVIVKGKPNGFWKQSTNRYVKDHAEDGLLGALGTVVTYPMQVAQDAVMYGLTNKVQRPSEGLGIKNTFGAIATDMALDPTNLIGAGIGAKIAKLGRFSKAIKSEGMLKTLGVTGKAIAEQSVYGIGDPLKNTEDLLYAKKWAEKYGYELPKNLERVAKSDILTDRTIRGVMNRHNTFVRGVSTNWDELAKVNPEILRHLEGKGIDWKNNPRAAAEYMSTHVPINTGYGRASLSGEVFERGQDAIYTSNSMNTAEGYTYGNGYITKVKRPTDFSSTNRQDWITKNSPDYYEDALPKTRSFASKDLDKLKPGDIDNFINQGRIKSDERGKIQSYWDQASSTKKELFKKHNISSSTTDDALDVYLEELQKSKETIANNLFQENYSNKILKTEGVTRSKAHSGFINDVAVNPEKNPLLINDDVSRKIVRGIYNKNAELYPSWKAGEEGRLNAKLFNENFTKDIRNENSEVLNNILNQYEDRIDYAHYLHIGTPGEKILEPVRSWKITPEMWKNKSRSHFNTYSKGLSAMSVTGAGIYGASQKNQSRKQGGLLY
jgi:hypothetical protein